MPDVYAKCLSDHTEVLGEAKTATDLETQHSQEQLLAFLRYCANTGKASLILAVPWDMAPSARALLKTLKAQASLNEAKTSVLDGLG